MVAVASAQTNDTNNTNDQKKRKQTLERAKANHLSKQLQMRLQYAKLKVEHGWQRQNLNEVENLYFHHSHLRNQRPPVLSNGAKPLSHAHTATAAPFLPSAQVPPQPNQQLVMPVNNIQETQHRTSSPLSHPVAFPSRLSPLSEPPHAESLSPPAFALSPSLGTLTPSIGAMSTSQLNTVESSSQFLSSQPHSMFPQSQTYAFSQSQSCASPAHLHASLTSQSQSLPQSQLPYSNSQLSIPSFLTQSQPHSQLQLIPNSDLASQPSLQSQSQPQTHPSSQSDFHSYQSQPLTNTNSNPSFTFTFSSPDTVNNVHAAQTTSITSTSNISPPSHVHTVTQQSTFNTSPSTPLTKTPTSAPTTSMLLSSSSTPAPLTYDSFWSSHSSSYRTGGGTGFSASGMNTNFSSRAGASLSGISGGEMGVAGDVVNIDPETRFGHNTNAGMGFGVHTGLGLGPGASGTSVNP
ncbi:hypothetical protein BJ138DRAFT_1127876 [Hygrophoropsis aurantiaca]|uniref:Uncharacterized protein n=1 Tax=Hygrophoropsis aurantiaca TaxID=72124 RepID=A0ACB8A7H1_9AGAM|nr:hypothetical protein BJ138DRAFT_1127876 [Hygrophoropsis aurantiaca]